LRASSPLSFFLVSSKKKLKGALGSLVEGVPRKGASQTNLTDPTVKGDVPLYKVISRTMAQMGEKMYWREFYYTLLLN
jgi:hypothetical protein